MGGFWNPDSFAGSNGEGFFTPPSVPILNQVTGAAAAYSLRLLRTAYSGSAIRVRRSSDNAEADIGFLSGELDQAALLAHCGAGSGFISKWYDQSGNGRDAAQATAGNQPRIVNAGVVDTQNGKPSIQFLSASSTYLTPVSSGTIDKAAAGFTINTVWNPTASANNAQLFYVSTTSATLVRALLQKNTSNKQAIFGRRLDADSSGSAASTATISGANHVSTAIFNYASDLVTGYIDGTQDGQINPFQAASTGQNTSNTDSATVLIGASGSPAANFLEGLVAEILIYKSALSTANRQTIERNQGSYFGVSVV